MLAELCHSRARPYQNVYANTRSLFQSGSGHTVRALKVEKIVHSALHDTPKKIFNYSPRTPASASSHNIVHGLSDAFCSSGGNGTSLMLQTRRGQQRGIRVSVVIPVAERLSDKLSKENVPTPTGSCADPGSLSVSKIFKKFL